MNDEVLRLQVRLVSKSCNEEKIKTIEFTPYPRNGLELKQGIEKELQIPVCLQTLYFKSAKVLDEQLASELYFREDDILTVEYLTEADTNDVNELLKRMQSFAQTIRTKDETTNPFLLDLDSLIQLCFQPPSSERVKANRVHFACNNGIETCLSLYRLLSPTPWNEMALNTLYLERSVLVILCDLSAAPGLRQLLLKHSDVIELLSKSILKIRVVPYKFVSTGLESTISSRLIVSTINEIMIRAMGVITNLSELPTNRVEIASQPDIIEQMTSTMLSPSFSTFCTHIIISTLLNLSYTPHTHKYLTTPTIINGVIDACKKYSSAFSTSVPTTLNDVKESDIIIIQYYTGLFFSFVCVGSTSFINSECFDYFSKDVLELMNRLLKKRTYLQVKEAEKLAGYTWSTLTPLMNLVHFSCRKHMKTIRPIVRDVYKTSVRLGLFSLKLACSTPDSISVLEEEGLVDFVVCLPWCIADELKDDAEEIVTLFCKNASSKPPKLLNIAKASIVANWGLPLNDMLSPAFMDNIFSILN